MRPAGQQRSRLVTHAIPVVGSDAVLKKMVGVAAAVMAKHVRLSTLPRSTCTLFNSFHGTGNIDLIECKVFG